MSNLSAYPTARTFTRSSSINNQFQLRVQAEQERRRRGVTNGLERYQFDPVSYIEEKLGWTPWGGSAEKPGQLEVIEHYILVLRQQHERLAYEHGELAEADLKYWKPGQTIKNRIRIAAGHTVGKTKLASALVNHFFDCFIPSIIYSFAPSWEQVHDLLWKEIKADRRDKGLPGRIMELELKRGDDHFAKGRATNNANGQGTSRAQGQHGRYLMFVLDEAEGVADFVFDAVDSMASGGIVVVLMLANPQTRTSRFHKSEGLSVVQNYRISCLHHPNVVEGREIVPGAIRRDYVELMLEKETEVVERHNPDEMTFEVPWHPGIIYKPKAEFMFRVLGIAPANLADNTFCPVGRYEAACKRTKARKGKKARVGVDVARFGKDYGTGYIDLDGLVWRACHMDKLDTTEYVQAIKRAVLPLADLGVTSLHIRVDGGGGFGGGVIDQLVRDWDLIKAFPDFQVFEVHFNGRPYDDRAYADLVTEMYALTGEILKVAALDNVPDALEGDLCERTFIWVVKEGISVRKLEEKKDFKKRMRRSPDDGDGCVLAVAPDFLFVPPETKPVKSRSFATF